MDIVDGSISLAVERAGMRGSSHGIPASDENDEVYTGFLGVRGGVKGGDGSERCSRDENDVAKEERGEEGCGQNERERELRDKAAIDAEVPCKY